MKHALRLALSAACVAASLSVAVMGAGCSRELPERTVTGQVFVVTAGRENVKLGLVEIAVLTAEETDSLVNQVFRAWGAGRDSARLAQKVAELADAEADLPRAVRSANLQEQRFLIGQESVDRKFEIIGAAERRVARLRAEVSDLSRYEDLNPDLAFVMDMRPKTVASALTDADGRFSVNVPRGEAWILAEAERKTLTGSESFLWLVPVAEAGATGGQQLLLSNQNFLSDALLDRLRARFVDRTVPQR